MVYLGLYLKTVPAVTGNYQVMVFYFVGIV